VRNTVAAPRGVAARAPASAAFASARAALGDHALLLTLILSGALVLRLAWIAYCGWQPLPDDDAFRYDFTARALADGRGYIHLNGAPTAFWPPGYAFLLAFAYKLFGAGATTAQLVNVLLGTATVGLVYLIGRRTVGERAALIASAIVAAFPSLIFFTAVTLSETAFTFVVLLAVYLLLRESDPERTDAGGRNLRLLFVSGLVIGFAALVRGQALLLPLVFVPFWLRSGFNRPEITDKLVALALAIGLVIAPWTIRNAAEMGAPVLISTNAGVDLWIGHHEGATGRGQHADQLFAGHPELDTTEREVQVNADGFREGIGYLLTHPLDETVLPLKKLFWLYSHDAEGLLWNEGHGGQPFLGAGEEFFLLGISNLYYYAVMGIFVFGAASWFSRRDPGRVLLISLVAYWTLVHIAFFGDPRFHAPIMPIVALLASVPIAALLGGGDHRQEEAEPDAEMVTLKLSEASDIIPMTPRADKL
jgi:4-amino-4-deoxy-L-arabinose transferase-like glycosyltransferase